jgi:hypothetical protein
MLGGSIRCVEARQGVRRGSSGLRGAERERVEKSRKGVWDVYRFWFFMEYNGLIQMRVSALCVFSHS